MNDVAALISDLVTAGVSAELVGRVAAALAQREVVPVLLKDEAAEKRRVADRERKAAVRRNPQTSADSADTPSPDKERSPRPPKEINPSHSPQGARARATQLPENFRPSEAHERLAADLGVSLETEFPAFCDFHRSKGSTFLDWNAALRTWIRRARSPPSFRVVNGGNHQGGFNGSHRKIGFDCVDAAREQGERLRALAEDQRRRREDGGLLA